MDPEEKSVQVFLLKEGKFVLDQETDQKGEISSRVLSGFTICLENIFEGCPG